ncbi:MAG: 3-hydroxyacyl-ACP dehydratase FabZ [Rhizobiales bacterium]|nr:3-hydroxyacyl-ACP dehydratase FabZ [Hyphomicrobiales bacterium]
MSGADTGMAILGPDDLLKLLPHRYPFLLVDRVIAIRGDESCIGIKNVTFNEPYFQGHFPNRPVMPGVLLIEGMAQTAGAICGLLRGLDRPPSAVFFLTVDKAKFRRPVVPGETVEYHMTKVTRRKQMWWYRGEAKVADQLVAEAVVGAMIADG